MSLFIFISLSQGNITAQALSTINNSLKSRLNFDFNSLENSYFQSGKGKKEYEWLAKNAKKYGFVQVYKYERELGEGYSEEKWHWSYMPVAEKLLKQYKEKVKYSDIKGFEGCEEAEKVKAIDIYVSNINTL